MNGLTFDTASVDELPHLIDIKLTMFLESGNSHLLAPDAKKTILIDYRGLYERHEATHFVARKDKKIIATVGAFIKSDLPFRYFKSSRYGFIGDVYTEPSFRSKGIATHLSQQALTWFKSQSIKMVRLLASDGGRPMYEKLGFVQTDEMVFFIPN